MSDDATQPLIETFDDRTDPAVVDDLRARLRAARWPDAPRALTRPGADPWALGADVAALRDLARYWAEEFDWLEVEERRFSRHPRLRVRVGGLRIHVIRARAVGVPEGTAPAVLLCHGWPDSAWRYLDVIDRLADPGAYGGDSADAVDVVVPEMPGYGWSEAPADGPIDAIAVAGLWAELMTVLGYDRFVAAGGDIGSHVARYLALDHPDRVAAVHRIDGGTPTLNAEPDDLSADERDWFAAARRWAATEGAYGAMHATKPQTAAVGLTDSPVGLLAWIVEKLHGWSDLRDGDLLSVYSRDDVLELVTQYWVTGCIAASMRMYSANAATPTAQRTRRVEVPSGFAIFPGDLVPAPLDWLERGANVVAHSRPERGGHFAPREQPEVYARELSDFARPFLAELR